ncbi:MAG: DUF883 C-terminal domain-containing protein [Verrucomicrobiota bacterium]
MESRTKQLLNDSRENVENWTEKTKQVGIAAADSARAIYQAAQENVVRSAQVTDKAIRKNPYAALGIAFGAGLLLGFLVKRRK